MKTFAQHMVTDHTKANQALAALAKKLDIEVPDDAALTDQAKKAILELRDESFDKAYANNQVAAHENRRTVQERSRLFGQRRVEGLRHQDPANP